MVNATILIYPPVSNADYPHALLQELNIPHVIRFADHPIDNPWWVIVIEGYGSFTSGAELFKCFCNYD